MAAVVLRSSPIWVQVSFLVAVLVDGLGQELFGLSDEAGQAVQVDGGVAEPVGGAELGEAAGRLAEDLEAVVAGARGG